MRSYLDSYDSSSYSITRVGKQKGGERTLAPCFQSRASWTCCLLGFFSLLCLGDRYLQNVCELGIMGSSKRDSY